MVTAPNHPWTFLPSNTTVTRHTDTYPFVSPTKYASTLSNKVVLITGAGRGIGRATALAFAAAGASVACLSRTRSDVDAVVAEIAKKGYPQSIAIAADVIDPSAPVAVIKEIQKELGPIDVLVNNAGISRISPLSHESNFSTPQSVIDVNIHGTLAFIHAVLPSMIERKCGTIINVVSVLAAMTHPYFHAYSCSKAGIMRATHCLELENRQHGILSYAVAPGMIADTTLGHDALNVKAHKELPELQKYMEFFVPSMQDTLTLAADTFVALAADPDAKWMSGRYVDVQQDLGEVLAEAKKGPEGRIEKEGLYQLKVDVL